MTISHAIGKNNTEGRTHTMCIEGTQGRVVGGRGPTWTGPAWAGGVEQGLEAVPAHPHTRLCSQVARTLSRVSQSWWSWNMGYMLAARCPRCC